MFPYTVHEICAMGEGKNERDNQQCFVFMPAYGLLMPESGEDAENRKGDTDNIE